MFKAITTVSVLIILFTTKSDGFQQLCSNKKSENICICKRITDDDTNLPITVGDCTRIGLQDFPQQSQLRNDLNLLDLSFNNVQKLEDSQNKFTSKHLKILKLSYNNITEIDEEFFDKTPNLLQLDLSRNNIASLGNARIFFNLKKLMVLNLSFNNLKTLPNTLLLSAESLQSLDFSYNNIGDWLMQSPNTLTQNLSLSASVTHLILNKVGLKELHNSYFDNYSNLKHLSLTDNNFDDIPTIPYSVTYLDFSGNELTTIQAKYLNYHSLKILKLNRLKKLEFIHKYAFYNLQSIEEISITNCEKLKEFNELVFGLLHKNEALSLRKLSLARNRLETLNYTYKYLIDHLEYIDLKNNPWKCNCDLLWLQELGNKDIRCMSPRSLRNKFINEIVEDDMPDCYPEKYGKRSHRILLPILIILILALLALVAYLIFYGPDWYANRSKRIGPQSPYSSTRLEED